MALYLLTSFFFSPFNKVSLEKPTHLQSWMVGQYVLMSCLVSLLKSNRSEDCWIVCLAVHVAYHIILCLNFMNSLFFPSFSYLCFPLFIHLLLFMSVHFRT